VSVEKLLLQYMEKVPEVHTLCSRCLATERWGGKVVLMVVDAAFTSIGLNYFQTVVPKVMEFQNEFLKTGKIRTLQELAGTEGIEELQRVWKNRRSWRVAREVSAYLAGFKRRGLGEKEALRHWARGVNLRTWRRDPIGRIKGVGINTLQYLRMMGGVDTVMPDKIVKRVINGILTEAGEKPVEDDLAFIEAVHNLAKRTDCRPIELCWMTWLVQSESQKSKTEEYAWMLPHI
jgi:hypothetical protein